MKVFILGTAFSEEIVLYKFDNEMYRPISVNSQPGGQNNKIVLHLKGLFLSGEKTTIVCPPDWELLKWVYRGMNISSPGIGLIDLTRCVGSTGWEI